MTTATLTKRSKTCQAKDPSTCRHHGHPVVSHANKAVDLQNKINEALGSKITVPSEPLQSKNPLINQALNSDMDWKGEKPDWWETYKAESENDPDIPGTPKLLDVIDSPSGKLAVVWHDEATEDKAKSLTLDSGYGSPACYYKSVETGEVVGYVRTAYIDEDTLKRSFGDDEFAVWRMRSRYGGTRYPFTRDDDTMMLGDRNLEGEELLAKRRQIWVAAHRDLEKSITRPDGSYAAYYNISVNDIPDDAQVAKDLKALSKKPRKEMQDKIKHFGVPYIDYSSVDGNLKGQGFGTALYLYSARQLGKQGKTMRASGTQTDAAQAVWKRFKKAFPNNVSSTRRTMYNRTTVHPMFDFRENK
jgi:hypothetical protein